MAGAGGLSPEAVALRDVVDRVLPDGPVVVALSGGADSAALCWAASQTRTARAVTVDHGLPASAGLVAAAGSIAADLEVPHEVMTVTPRSSSEGDLRVARLAALEASARRDEVVATGHTLDDQAETVLGNALRGSGTAGLGGIPRHRAPFVRPLLDVPRATTRAVAVELDLRFLDDPDNDRLDIRRSGLRATTIPELARRYNPQLVSALGRLGRAANADDSVLEERAARVPIRMRDGAILVPAAAVQTLPAAVSARVMRRAIRRAAGPHAGSSADVEAAIRIATGGRVTIGAGVDVAREGPWIVLQADRVQLPETIDLRGPETRFGSWVFSLDGDDHRVGRFTASLPDSAGMVVRMARPGDRVAITDGTKTVRRALAEAGIPARQRARWPVVASGERIVWIPGVRRAAELGTATVRVRARRTT